MRVAVEYFGPAREAAGVSRDLVELPPPATAVDVLALVAQRHGPRLQRLLLRDGRIAPGVVVAIGNRSSDAPEAEPLQDGDEIIVIPPISGGSGELTDEERAVYEWQMWVPGLGEAGQARLKGASVLVSRIGGLGGVLAYELAAAGVGRLVLAHAGNVRPSDLNRQLLMTHAAIGKSRVECAARRLRDLNPRLEVETVPENISSANADQLVASVDVVACCAPLFEERLAMNAACVRHGRPMVDAAMYELTGQLTTIIPGRTGCLACRVADGPDTWKREFPVIGAVSGAVGGLGAMEVIKLLTGLGEPLANRLLTFDLRDNRYRTVPLALRRECPVCQGDAA